MGVPPGLIIIENFISEAEESKLVQELRAQSILEKGHLRFSNTAQQEYGPRISDAMELITDKESLPLPARCQALLASVAREVSRRKISGAQTYQEPGVFLRVNHYSCPTGGYMHKHLDSKKCFGPVIACCSLLANATMTFYDTRGNSFGLAKVHDVKRVPIPRRSLYLMTGPSREDWQHGILKDDCLQERFSMTFRTVRPDAPKTTAKAFARSINDRKLHNVTASRARAKRPQEGDLLVKRPAARPVKKARTK